MAVLLVDVGVVLVGVVVLPDATAGVPPVLDVTGGVDTPDPMFAGAGSFEHAAN